MQRLATKLLHATVLFLHLGCTFEPGKGGHLIVRLDDKMSVLPMHGSRKEIGKGLENSIKKNLGLK